jgi:hypothetical protein
MQLLLLLKLRSIYPPHPQKVPLAIMAILIMLFGLLVSIYF